jgi:hypothetical protein
MEVDVFKSRRKEEHGIENIVVEFYRGEEHNTSHQEFSITQQGNTSDPSSILF